MTQWLVRHFIARADDTADPAVRQSYGLLSGVIGIILNLLLSGGKFLAGVLSGSIAITADAFNNLSDAGSSVVTLVGFQIAGKKADDAHPFGHGRMEYLSGLAVAVAILLVGVELAKSSVKKIFVPEATNFSLVSVGVLLTSILVKLWMNRFNHSLSRHIHSTAMAATAADSLSDVAATSAVLLGTLVDYFLQVNIDGWVGLAVAAFILRSGWGAAKDTLDPLLGQNPDPELVRGVEETVMAHSEIMGMHDLIIHDYGPGRRMLSLHAEVPASADVMAMHDVIDNTERELHEKFHVEAVIHMDPLDTNDETVRMLRDKVASIAREIDPVLSTHDFRMTAGPDHKNLIFDVVVPHTFPLSDEQVRAAFTESVKQLGENYYTVISIDHSYVELP
ncbi:MAG: cation diffusion facilitator family transporter [Intestinimonas sp.]|jgi:cation diffusion facilitator family transporter|nr:cation diffusion facilitator family transporter [Intestinimonas sp.]